MPITVSDIPIAALGFVVIAVGLGVAWMLGRRRGSLTGVAVALALLVAIAMFGSYALVSLGWTGLEVVLAASFVVVTVGLGVFLARQWNDPQKASENRTLLILLGLAAAGVVLRVIGQLGT